MTSDAKIGLLLGLVFIVIIAFVINGLPDFLQGDEEKIFVTGINTESDLGDIGNNAALAVKTIERMESPQPPEPAKTKEEGVRFSQQLPNQNRPLRKTKFKPLPEKVADRTRSYTVKSGDNLPVIAKKFYGDEKGNTHAIIQKLYKFNSKTMTSPDDLLVGQKLIIPPIASLQNGPAKKIVSASGVLKAVKDFGNRKYTEIKSTIGTKRNAGSEYIVQPDDSLWQIAAEHLGNGNRYMEIVKLNRRIIDDPEDIYDGMRLRLPAR
jgi:nucleoid-associated protein YgaU